jgi:hypothetical protein
MSERYLVGRESRIQAAAKMLFVLQKYFHNKKDDPAVVVEVTSDMDTARGHLHELESHPDAYSLEASRARPDLLDKSTGKRTTSSSSSRRSAPDGSDDDEADVDGSARPRALPPGASRRTYGQVR